MFQFGLFSTHIPYILTIVLYLLSYGYYAFNKPTTSSEVLTSKVKTATLQGHQSVDTERFHPNTAKFFHDGTAASVISKIPPVEWVAIRVATSSGSNRVRSIPVAFELFSRPPTTFCQYC